MPTMIPADRKTVAALTTNALDALTHRARWIASTATDQGPRLCMADAAHTRFGRETGRQAWAVADGVGDSYEAEDAARMAARAATESALVGGAAHGIAAARTALQDFYRHCPRGQEGDCVMVTAVPLTEQHGGGWDIAWVGDCRAYVFQDGTVRQVTEDHTQGERMRHSDNEWTRELARGFDHIVTRTVRGDEPIASARVTGDVTRLMLCTDGLSKVLPAEEITAILGSQAGPRRISRALITATRAHTRARDNIAVTVVARHPHHP